MNTNLGVLSKLFLICFRLPRLDFGPKIETNCSYKIVLILKKRVVRNPMDLFKFTGIGGLGLGDVTFSLLVEVSAGSDCVYSI